MTTLEDTLAALRDRVEIQDEAIAQLRDALAPPVRMGRTAFLLSPQEEAILSAILRSEVATFDQIRTAFCAGHRYSRSSGRGMVKVIVFNLRRKLAARGISFKNEYGVGYAMAPDEKTKLRAVLAQSEEAGHAADDANTDHQRDASGAGLRGH